MGVPVLILGESGTGKSASLRNFKADDLKVINVANKPLPFKNKFESISSDDYRTVIYEIEMTKKKVIVIDDAQYLMANEFMRRATERGFDKFTEIAQSFWNLVNTVKDLPDDTIVYFLAHIERDANGNEKIKTIGKLLDEKITVEGMFTIVLKTNVTDGVYSFLTQNNGHDTVKSPILMFSSYAIDNDLKFVDEKIRNYYELGEFLTDEELADIEENIKHDVTPIKEEKKRRGKKKEEPEKAPTEEKEEEKPKRNRRKVSEELEEERKEVKAKNEEIIAETNTTESGEPIPFEEAKEPELEALPKRKSRKKSSDQVPSDSEPKATVEGDEATEKPRRTRSRKTSTNEPTETIDVPGTEKTSEVPTRRRRRKTD